MHLHVSNRTDLQSIFMNILLSTIALFSIASLAGIYLSSIVLSKAQTPAFVLAAKALLTIAGLAAIIYSYTQNNIGRTGIAFILSAAVIGIIAVAYSNTIEKKAPEWLWAGHGIAALTAFALLISFAF